MIDSHEFNILLRKIKYDEDAKQKFCFEYYNLLKMYISSKYSKFQDWEDILHDVISKIFSTDWSDYPYVNKPTQWLYTIADNHAKDLFKRTNRIFEFKENLYPGFNIEDVDIRNDVREAMKHLTRDEQYILYAHYWLGKELYTIAEEMGKSYVSIRVKIFRARNSLKKFL